MQTPEVFGPVRFEKLRYAKSPDFVVLCVKSPTSNDKLF
jgi:hypothetical protein